MLDNNSVHVMTELEITKAALAVGWVKFSYTKADGSKRIAIGTTNHELIRTLIGREYVDNSAYYDACGYFDLTRCDWRRFKAERFIGLELNRLSNEQAVAESFVISISLGGDYDEIEHLRSNYSALIGVELSVKLYRSACESIGFVRSTKAPKDWESVARLAIADMQIESEPKVTTATHTASTYTATATPKQEPSNFQKEQTAARKADRAELIAELLKLRQRESEILAELLK